jgi:hypothetical protein
MTTALTDLIDCRVGAQSSTDNSFAYLPGTRDYSFMRMSDVKVDTEYAHRENSWRRQISRVVVPERLAGGKLRVEILEPAKDTEKTLRRGAVVEVTSRSLVSTWQAWPELAAAEQEERDRKEAEIRDRHARMEYEKAADPGRPLPDEYDSHSWFSDLVDSVESLRDWPLPTPARMWRADRTSLEAAALKALTGLPVNLVRDLLAAAAHTGDKSLPADESPDNSV